MNVHLVEREKRAENPAAVGILICMLSVKSMHMDTRKKEHFLDDLKAPRIKGKGGIVRFDHLQDIYDISHF